MLADVIITTEYINQVSSLLITVQANLTERSQAP